MSKSKTSKKAAGVTRGGRRRIVVADGEVTVVGNLVTLRGKMAEAVEGFCQRERLELRAVLNTMLRAFVDRCKIERPKRVEDINWETYADLVYVRLQGRKAGSRAKS